ncbi:hypothetical protein HDF14_004505 [Edaphobacter lichenicola]|uniref:Uncharacterized protein n=1 Tax=Tunturiibacter gelidiferens TaxID=3069689 RepID=A0A9X0QIJ2_9BACT|nr:hypothetical protein [Edaphobacter lichenicola]
MSRLRMKTLPSLNSPISTKNEIFPGEKEELR